MNIDPEYLDCDHEDQFAVGVCMNESCQAEQKIVCINCLLQSVHAQCPIEFYETQPSVQTQPKFQQNNRYNNKPLKDPPNAELTKQTLQLNKLLEQFDSKVNKNQDIVDGIGRVYQYFKKEDSPSTKLWEYGYQLITCQVMDATQSTEKLILQINQISNSIDELLSMQAEEYTNQRIAQPIQKPVTSQKSNWDTITSQKPLIIQTRHKISTLALSPDGKYIASAGYGYDYSIQTWNPVTGQQVGNRMTGHKQTINSINYSRCGKYIVSGSNDNTIRQWDPYTQVQLGESIFGHQDAVWGVQYTRDQKYIVSCSLDKTIRLWDSKTGEECFKRFHNEKPIWNLCLSPTQKDLIFGDTQGRISIYNYERHRRQFIQGHLRCVICQQCSADGQLIVSSGDENSIKIWDKKLKKQIRTFRAHTSFVLAVNFSPDMRYIVSGSDDSTVRLWDQVTGNQIGSPLATLENPLSSAQFSMDGQYIITGSDKFLGIMTAPIDF